MKEKKNKQPLHFFYKRKQRFNFWRHYQHPFHGSLCRPSTRRVFSRRFLFKEGTWKLYLCVQLDRTQKNFLLEIADILRSAQDSLRPLAAMIGRNARV